MKCCARAPPPLPLPLVCRVRSFRRVVLACEAGTPNDEPPLHLYLRVTATIRPDSSVRFRCTEPPWSTITIASDCRRQCSEMLAMRWHHHQPHTVIGFNYRGDTQSGITYTLMTFRSMKSVIFGGHSSHSACVVFSLSEHFELHINKVPKY